MTQILFVLAAVFLGASLLVRLYAMSRLTKKDVTEQERLANYKKIVLVSYGLLVPAIAIIIWLFAAR
jgi:hypothetical protein